MPISFDPAEICVQVLVGQQHAKLQHMRFFRRHIVVVVIAHLFVTKFFQSGLRRSDDG